MLFLAHLILIWLLFLGGHVNGPLILYVIILGGQIDVEFFYCVGVGYFCSAVFCVYVVMLFVGCCLRLIAFRLEGALCVGCPLSYM